MNDNDNSKCVSGWIEINIQAPSEQTAAAADFLVLLTGRGVEINESADSGGAEQVKAFLEAGPKSGEQIKAIEDLVRRLESQAGASGLVHVALTELDDQDWSENWKRHFHPKEMAPGLWVAPPWEPMEDDPSNVVVIIDPGQAFGTGHHASTALCLQRLARMKRKNYLPGRLLDLGCGTGILALAGLKLGIASALALDLDPLALEATRHNAKLNNLSGRIEVGSQPLDRINEKFPLIMANITALDLTELARAMAAKLEPGGELVTSGMMQGQDEGVRRALEDAGLGMVERMSLGEWCCLVMAR
jgi:ribosomal protein L11 methyltransferase